MSPAFRPGSILDRAFGSKQERALAPPGVSMYGGYGVPAPFKPQESLDAYDYNVWLYRSVLTIAMEMASVDLKLKDTTSTEMVKYVERHQAIETMRRPQETKNGKCQLSGMTLRIVTGMHLLLNGEAFWIFNKRTRSQYGGAPTYIDLALPLHHDLVSRIPTWFAHLNPDEPLFPKLKNRRTWLMVKKDLERAGIPYETPEGIADFHAAGRHSYITGLMTNGAKLPEAKELARHSDVKQTMKYTHIGMKGQAAALKNLPYQERIGSASDGSDSPPASPAGTKKGKKKQSKETTNPAGVRGYVVLCRPVALNGPEGQSSAQEWRREYTNRTFSDRDRWVGDCDDSSNSFSRTIRVTGRLLSLFPGGLASGRSR